MTLDTPLSKNSLQYAADTLIEMEWNTAFRLYLKNNGDLDSLCDSIWLIRFFTQETQGWGSS